VAAELFDLLGDAVFEHIGKSPLLLSCCMPDWIAGHARPSRFCGSTACQAAAVPLPAPPAGDLLQQRASIAANVRRTVAGFRDAEAAEKAASAVPSYGSTVTVMSESQARQRGSAAGL
jgi:hypothetical protein